MRIFAPSGLKELSTGCMHCSGGAQAKRPQTMASMRVVYSAVSNIYGLSLAVKSARISQFLASLFEDMNKFEDFLKYDKNKLSY